MNSRFWTNHYLSTFLWWVVLILFIRDFQRCDGGWWSTDWEHMLIDIEMIALLILTFIRGYNFHKFKNKQKNL